ncbi:helix-turn-helix transcriptional regulator [Nocardia macrotermitis]|uniref:HTH luxR-type domain-containing protein n=1 Tax=Nocardia macrotermitis TaxID=2585198 RepID=A0A7K0D4H9_9NOCA|nr:LuxR family transcriptional regulator [Nocardia macrotermitis]MQY20646.1 hypothetical protein [Nocardia macrotermitis]
MSELPAVRLIGRDDEQGQLSAIVTGASGLPLILRGETGVGKSALLEFAVEQALRAGYAVIRATGVEAESELPYAGLHQLLHPLLPHIDGLGEPTRAMFEAVFGRHATQPPSVMALGIAVLNLLAAATSDQPLLLVVDDGQWLDGPSAEVCGFVGRRLSGSAVRLVIAVRADIVSGFDTAALPERVVAPLNAQAAADLLDRRHPVLNTRLRRLVLDRAQGNPLALLDLPIHVEGQADFESPDEVFAEHALPVPRRLQRVYGTRIAALADPVRAELLMGALDGVGARPGPGVRYRMRGIDAAVKDGLLHHDPITGVTFRHPLVRATVVQTATPDERRDAHAALAEVHRDDLERRATHLAAAAVDPDERVAAVLESAAESATRRGGAATAVTWLTRAAELSETDEQRRRRLGEAAYIAGYATRLGQALRIVRSDPVPGGDESPAEVVAWAFTALYRDGDARGVHERVLIAIRALREDDAAEQPEVVLRLLNLLLVTDHYAGDAALWGETFAVLDELGEFVPPLSRIYRDSWSDVVRHGAGMAEQLRRMSENLAELEPWEVVRVASAAYRLDVLHYYGAQLRHMVEREIETGAVVSGLVMLHLITLDRIGSGEWDEAERTATICRDRAAELGYELFVHQSVAYLAQVAALRGRIEEARELLAVAESWARPRGVGILTQLVDAVATSAALGQGDFEAAYLHAIGMTPPGEFAPCVHQAVRGVLDLVEAAVHTGRAAEARRHARAAWDIGLPAISPRLAISTFGALAMTAETEAEADEMLSLAENHAEARHFPFEIARIRLAYGARVRHRPGGRTRARQFLTPAAESFDRLGARPWAERARRELRATGLAVRAAEVDPGVLTWQERRIAELAAAGLSNKEIGRELYLSPRTVGTHLYRIFPKLGITSRAALRDALSGEGNASDT